MAQLRRIDVDKANAERGCLNRRKRRKQRGSSRNLHWMGIQARFLEQLPWGRIGTLRNGTVCCAHWGYIVDSSTLNMWCFASQGITTNRSD